MPKGRTIKKKSNVDEWIFNCKAHMDDDNSLEDEYINNNDNDSYNENEDVKDKDKDKVNIPVYHFSDPKIQRKRRTTQPDNDIDDPHDYSDVEKFKRMLNLN